MFRYNTTNAKPCDELVRSVDAYPLIPLETPADPAVPRALVRAQAPAFHEPVDPIARRNAFWQLISELDWTNASEGACNRQQVARKTGAWTDQWNLFAEYYGPLMAEKTAVLLETGIFGNDRAKLQSIASHVIALGRETSELLFQDLDFLVNLVLADEIQGLNEWLPPNVQAR